jgi:hypothetical protein
MKAFALIDKDERAIAVENASYRWALNVLSFGLLIDVMYRSWVWREAAWDLIALVVLSGAVSFVYQLHHRIFHRQWLRRMGLLMGLIIPIQVLVAFLMIWLMKSYR